MKRPKLKGLSRDSGTDIDEQATNAIIDAIQSTDKTIEIRPADRSGMRMSRLLMLVAGTLGLAYWLRSSRQPKEVIQTATKETADRTLSMSEKAAETIQGGGGRMAAKIDEGGETVADRVEEGSEKAGEMVEEAGEEAADKADKSDGSAGDRHAGQGMGDDEDDEDDSGTGFSRN